MILYAIDDRKARIEVGYGLEPILPDGKVGSFQREAIPFMRSGNYSQALLLVASRVADVIAKDAGVQLSTPQLAPSPTGPQEQPAGGISVAGIVLVIIVILVVLLTPLRTLLFWMLFSSIFGGGRGGGYGGGGWGGGGFGGGANLESVILFGSAATEDFHPEFSNVNLFCVVRDSSFAALQAVASAVQWWDRQKQPPPLFMTRHEVERSIDVFSIELIDMQQHHRVLFGEDVLQGFEIPANLHRVQVEYELREKLALLRRHLLLASGNDSRMWELLTRSLSSFVTLFRHALMVLDQPAPHRKREAVHALSQQIKFDPSGVLDVLDVRERKANRKKLDVKDVFSRYLAAVEQVMTAVDRMLHPGSRR